MGLLDSLRDQEPSEGGGDDYAEGWRPQQAGEGVEGIVQKVNYRITENHPDPGYPIVTIRQADGSLLSVHGMTQVLKNELNDRHLRPGDELAVIYDGTKQSRSGRNFHAFRVASKQGAAPAQQQPQTPLGQGLAKAGLQESEFPF